MSASESKSSLKFKSQLPRDTKIQIQYNLHSGKPYNSYFRDKEKKNNLFGL